MKSSLLYAALALYGLFPNKILQASENRLLLIPDQFQIAETLHKPRFSIVEVETGYNVTIKYEANIEGLDGYLYQKYGDAAFEKDTFHAELLPKSVHHLSDIFKTPNIVLRSWKATYQLNEIHLSYNFTKEYTKEQINGLFMFGFLFASVDAEVQCTGEIISKICDSTLKGVPLFNQYRLDQDVDARTALDDYYLLNRYVNIQSIGAGQPALAQDRNADIFIKEKLFKNSGCRSELGEEEARVCLIVQARSENQRITDAITNLSHIIWPADFRNTGLEFYILGPNDFSVTNQGSFDPNHCSPLDAFCDLFKI